VRDFGGAPFGKPSLVKIFTKDGLGAKKDGSIVETQSAFKLQEQLPTEKQSRTE
jgi:hypothetical protein